MWSCNLDRPNKKLLRASKLILVAASFVILASLLSCSTGGTSGTGARGLQLNGFLLDSLNNPISGVEVSIVPIAEPAARSAEITDEFGAFTIFVPDPAASQLVFSGNQLNSVVPLDFVPGNARRVDATFSVSQEGAVQPSSVNVTEEYPATPTIAGASTNSPAAPTAAPTNVPQLPTTKPEPSATSDAPVAPTAGSTIAPPQPTSTRTPLPSATTAPQPPTATPTASPTPGFQLGDLNCDGAVNSNDIDPFVMALTNPAEYAVQFPNCDINLADMNRDGNINNFDLDLFIALLG